MKAHHLLTSLLLPLAVACSTGGEASENPKSQENAVTPSEPTPEPGPEQGTDETTDTTEDVVAATGSTEEPAEQAPLAAPTDTVATFGAGCFWCVEAVLEQIEGVKDVRSGYMGGHVDDPSYRAVCSGSTGHAEVVQVDFDPEVLPYEELVHWFWRLHDPTTLNRQGADSGTQYRSAIFVHSPEQRAVAERSLQLAQDSFTRPIVTEITDASTFWEAEDYHQDYYRANKTAGYCRAVIRPKLDKLGLEK